jgi:acetyl esterase
MTDVRNRIESAAARGVMALPERAQRVLAGRPIVVDGQQLHVEAQLTLRLIDLVGGGQDLEGMTPAQARSQLRQDTRRVAGPKLDGVNASDTSVSGATGPLRARLYAPDHADAEAGSLLVYFHGGGFVTGDLDTHDRACRYLARQSGARLLAVDYRLAPEHPFPSALDDALTAFRYAAEHAGELGADPARIAVGGDSAGGNLAAGVARITARATGPRPAFQLLFYPWLDLSSKRESYVWFREGFYLTETDLDWHRRHYLAAQDDALDPRCSPLLADDLTRLPPAYIATAGFDPLRDEGEEYAHRLRAAGVPVALRRHRGLFHGFFNTIDVGRAGREAVLEASGALRLGLSGNPAQLATGTLRAHEHA